MLCVLWFNGFKTGWVLIEELVFEYMFRKYFYVLRNNLFRHGRLFCGKDELFCRE